MSERYTLRLRLSPRPTASSPTICFEVTSVTNFLGIAHFIWETIVHHESTELSSRETKSHDDTDPSLKGNDNQTFLPLIIVAELKPLQR